MDRKFTKVEVKTCGTCLFWKGQRESTKLDNGNPHIILKINLKEWRVKI